MPEIKKRCPECGRAHIRIAFDYSCDPFWCGAVNLDSEDVGAYFGIPDDLVKKLVDLQKDWDRWASEQKLYDTQQFFWLTQPLRAELIFLAIRIADEAQVPVTISIPPAFPDGEAPDGPMESGR